MQSQNDQLRDSAMNGDAIPLNNLNALIKDALQQQAKQFETIIFERLQNELSKVGLTGSDQQPEKSHSHRSTSNQAHSHSSTSIITPVQAQLGHRRVTLPASNKAASVSPPLRKFPRSSMKKTSHTTHRAPAPEPSMTHNTASNRKGHPLQLKRTDLPEDFKQMKEALFIHVKMLWGLLHPNDVPAPPNAHLLQDFYKRFSNIDQVQAVVDDPAARELIAHQDILALRSARVGRSKIAKGLINLAEGDILYMHALMAKVAMVVWSPDINASPDSLYNSACRLVALNSFRELVSYGTYDYMNVNLKYADSMSLFRQAYNHYVHFVMANRFKSESKAPGRFKTMNEKKNIQKNRERLRDSRIEFLFCNRTKYPPRYRKVLDDTLAHSDDEYLPESNIFVIKTLVYRSNNTNKFIRQLDAAMLKDAQLKGSTARRRVRKLPKVPQPSNFKKIPKQLPVDFYSPTWFKDELDSHQRKRQVNSNEVAFLPNASKSFGNHPDEKLGDKAFNAKYFDIIAEQYDLGEEEEEVQSENSGESDAEDAIQLDGEQISEEEESEFYSEGEFGHLYQMNE